MSGHNESRDPWNRVESIRRNLVASRTRKRYTIARVFDTRRPRSSSRSRLPFIYFSVELPSRKSSNARGTGLFVYILRRNAFDLVSRGRDSSSSRPNYILSCFLCCFYVSFLYFKQYPRTHARTHTRCPRNGSATWKRVILREKANQKYGIKFFSFIGVSTLRNCS